MFIYPKKKNPQICKFISSIEEKCKLSRFKKTSLTIPCRIADFLMHSNTNSYASLTNPSPQRQLFLAPPRRPSQRRTVLPGLAELADCVEGPSGVPLPTYFVDDYGVGSVKFLLAVAKDSANLRFKMDGLRICENLFWLKGSGKFTLHGLCSSFLGCLVAGKIRMEKSVSFCSFLGCSFLVVWVLYFTISKLG